jgi:hypothetical protein
MAKNRIVHVKADLRRFANVLDIGIGLVVEKVARDLHGKIVKRTPVDTGRARASWDVAIGAPSAKPPPLPGKESYPEPAFDGSKIDGTSPVFITSNLVYMEPLENGHSKQQPLGMVRISVAEVLAEIDAILANVDKEAEAKAS